jgi:hypothetical protein
MDSNYENVFLTPMVMWCRGTRELLPQSFECTRHCCLVTELALEADCQLRRRVLTFDYFFCPVRWLWLTSVLVPIGLIRQPSQITPPYASLQFRLWMWRHCISLLKHWLTSTNVCGFRTSQTTHLIFTTFENLKSHCVCSGYWFLSCVA